MHKCGTCPVHELYRKPFSLNKYLVYRYLCMHGHCSNLRPSQSSPAPLPPLNYLNQRVTLQYRQYKHQRKMYRSRFRLLGTAKTYTLQPYSILRKRPRNKGKHALVVEVANVRCRPFATISVSRYRVMPPAGSNLEPCSLSFLCAAASDVNVPTRAKRART